jgi:hypothetical protein
MVVVVLTPNEIPGRWDCEKARELSTLSEAVGTAQVTTTLVTVVSLTMLLGQLEKVGGSRSTTTTVRYTHTATRCRRSEARATASRASAVTLPLKEQTVWRPELSVAV